MEYTVRTENVFVGNGHLAEQQRFDLDDDEMILDSEMRNVNRVVVAIASPVEYECGEPLDSGGACSRTVESPDDNCFQHTGDA